MIVKRDPGIDHLLGIEIAIAKSHLRDWWVMCFLLLLLHQWYENMWNYGLSHLWSAWDIVWWVYSLIYDLVVWSLNAQADEALRGQGSTILPLCRDRISVSPKIVTSNRNCCETKAMLAELLLILLARRRPWPDSAVCKFTELWTLQTSRITLA